jgi:hypothetical protein
MDLLETLASFNRKERFFLVGWALGNKRFELDASFRDKLGDRLSAQIAADAYVAMDYHLDWLYASLWECRPGQVPGPFINDDPRRISATQEDVDLLIAFNASGVTHIVMLEAKGATGWTNKQLRHKADRLKAIFGETGAAWAGVVPHFAIASPVESSHLITDEWPRWMKTNDGKAFWLPMEMPRSLRRVTRCDETGRPRFDGRYWRVITAKRGSPEIVFGAATNEAP